jgi:hypothetical protein
MGAMPDYKVKEPYIPDWRRYPVERCVMNPEKNRAFRAKCREIGMAKSRVINTLIDKLLTGEISL